MFLLFTHSLTHLQRQEHPAFLYISSVSWQMAHRNTTNVHKASHTSPLLFFFFLKNFKNTSHRNIQSTAPTTIKTFIYFIQQYYAHVSGSTVTFIRQFITISSQSASNVQWAMWLLQTMSLFNYGSFCSTKHKQTSPLLSSGTWHSAEFGQYFSPAWWFHLHAHSISSLLWNVGTYLPNHMVSHHRSHHNKNNTSKFYWPSEKSSSQLSWSQRYIKILFFSFLYSDLFCKQLLRECPYFRFIILYDNSCHSFTQTISYVGKHCKAHWYSKLP